MRNLTVLALFLFLLQNIAFPQSCLPEGITFTTQAQIDSFQINYPNCTEIEGNVKISGDDITNLYGLNVLSAFNSILLIEDNIMLTSLSGLENITSIGGQVSTNHFALILSGNDGLINMEGLNNLRTIAGGLKLINNPALTSLIGLDSLTYIGGDLGIEHNNELTSLEGLGKLIAIGHSLIIDGANNIESLASLQNLMSISGDLVINRTNLINLEGLEKLNYLPGNLHISGNMDLISLSGLDNLTFIGGDVIIGDYAGVTNALQSLDLINVTYVGGSIAINRNTDLVDLVGLNRITSIGGNLSIYDNDNLFSLMGLDSLSSIGGYLHIYKNESLTSLNALSSLNSINGYLNILENISLSSLSGLDHINAESISHLRIFNNSELCNCEIQNLCEYLLTPNGIVAIYNNGDRCNSPSEIADQCGIILDCLPYGNYYFVSQSQIDSYLSNFPDCSDLSGSVWIEGSNIYNLHGLNSITSIEGSLYIQYNDALEDLKGLENLTSIGRYLMIEHNELLISLEGLENLDVGSLSILYVLHNPLLSFCNAQGICVILSNGIETIGIHDNAPGCNSEEEVKAACEVGLDESAVGSWQLADKIFPNPSSSEIIIEIPEVQGITELAIFNLNGQEIARQQIIEPMTVIDISHLAGGIYFVKVSDEHTFHVAKFVKR